jgi:hypothetical protein
LRTNCGQRNLIRKEPIEMLQKKEEHTMRKEQDNKYSYLLKGGADQEGRTPTKGINQNVPTMDTQSPTEKGEKRGSGESYHTYHDHYWLKWKGWTHNVRDPLAKKKQTQSL